MELHMGLPAGNVLLPLSAYVSASLSMSLMNNILNK